VSGLGIVVARTTVAWRGCGSLVYETWYPRTPPQDDLYGDDRGPQVVGGCPRTRRGDRLDLNRGQTLSVIVPVYGSAAILPETHRRLTKVLTELGDFGYEIIYVNDGSPDNANDILKDIVVNDRQARLLSLSRNFGHQAAITAGLDHASGDAVVIIDDDLQDPPEVIAQMVERWREGNKVVFGTRAVRRGDSAFKRASAKLFYRLLSRLSDRPIPLDAGDFRLMDRSVVEVLREMREESRYMRGMVSWVGFQQCGLSYERDARYAGKSNYKLRHSMRLALDGIVSFSTRPLLLSTALGMVVTLCACVAAVWLVIHKLVDPESVLPGTTTVVVTVLFMGGVQLVTIGILGAYLGKVFSETKRRPLYVAAERLGFADHQAPPPRGRSSLVGREEEAPGDPAGGGKD
jgi:glycosyltransferase involved in cell wall biosynthesis